MIFSPIKSPALPLAAFVILAALVGRASTENAGRAPRADAAGYARHVRPLLRRYCFDCHSGKSAQADLDLPRFSSLADIRKAIKAWQKLLEMVDSGQMPPKQARQPTLSERGTLRNWVHGFLANEALTRAGDPGRVVLRRLSNAEYTYTIRDLTGIELDPAKEFPVDGAAGEGFTNTGSALVMSPALLTKYLDAAKETAAHAVLLPDGIRFSPMTTRRDWTEELLAEIRGAYRHYTESGGGIAVNLQGIRFDTKDGGVLPLRKYLGALLAERAGDPDATARAAGLSAKYLRILRKALNGKQPSFLLDPIRARWRAARPADVPALVTEISRWQAALWRFNPVGHIGKVGGPRAWMEPIAPLQERQEIRLKLPVQPNTSEITLYLAASDAGDGNEGDTVVWQRPRLVAPGRPDLLLREVRGVSGELAAQRERIFTMAAQCLNASAEAAAAPGKTEVAELARKHGVEADTLTAWLDYLGIGTGKPVRLEGHLTNQIKRVSGYEFINGWGSNETPNLVANSSAQHVRIPGNMKPHGVAVHPSPKLAALVGWRSPVAAALRVEAVVQHAHPECGNGVTYAVEFRRSGTRQRLAAGIAHGGKEVKPPAIENLKVQPGDVVSLLIGPREGNHACDLTAVDLMLTSGGENPREWNLAKEVAPDVLAGNPHADRFGNAGVWHFYVEPDRGGPAGPVVPPGSLLAQWQATNHPDERQRLAEAVQKLLTSGPPAAKDSVDAALYRQLASFSGPLLAANLRNPPTPAVVRNAPGDSRWGLDPARFGKHPDGLSLDADSLCVRAPSLLEIRLPADLVEGTELVTTGTLHPEAGPQASVQFQVLTTRPQSPLGLITSGVTVPGGKGTWTEGERPLAHTTPIVVSSSEASTARKRIEAGLDEFRRLFPAALCYTKIVPVDEVVTLTLYHREDHHFARLMLDRAQAERLDRLWDQLHYVSQDALTLVDAFEQLWQYATQDADPKVFEPMREPIRQRAATFRRRLITTEPMHLDAILRFANGAYRRPLTAAEKTELRTFYRKLREQEIPHEEVIRLTIARVLVSPAFLYRAEKPGPGAGQSPVSDWELASRLSYFLWSSGPDDELRRLAATGQLRRSEVLRAQTQRMLRDPRVRRLAIEFGCQWLHVHGFDELDEKSERHFPTFLGLRKTMYEESIRFFTDFFQNDRPILNLVDADYTFLTEDLAKHYGIPGVAGPHWRKVDRVKPYARGGILGQAATLARQSGASRTSPILRGNWVFEVLLGERLPRPPKEVPRLPEDETATEGLTVRQLVEKHSKDPRCASCHAKVDPIGFALEGYDAIGRFRTRDLANRAIDTRAKTPDGVAFTGIEGLRNYLLTQRRDAFLRQFCKKLLGYALGRAVQLSDEPLLARMQANLPADSYRIGVAVDLIVQSRQFREIRGKLSAHDD